MLKYLKWIGASALLAIAGLIWAASADRTATHMRIEANEEHAAVAEEILEQIVNRQEQIEIDARVRQERELLEAVCEEIRARCIAAGARLEDCEIPEDCP